jgi:hypothetical protein
VKFTESDIEVACVAFHGVRREHKYSSTPWAALAKSQQEYYRKAMRAALDQIPERESKFRQAIEGLLHEWELLTKYGSPIAKAANERIAFAKEVLK